MQTNSLLLIPEKIETARLTLSKLKREDAEEIFYTYASKPECTKFVSWPTHQSIDDTREFLISAAASWRRGADFSFAVRLESTGRLIGGCGFLWDNGKAQIGYVFGSLHWGKGYATETAASLIDLLRNQPGLFRIGSFVDSENIASVRVLKKIGMVEEARLSKWFRFPNQDNQPKDCILFKLPD